MPLSSISSDDRFLGAWLGAGDAADGQLNFRVWAPKIKSCELVLFTPGGEKKYVAMDQAPRGYFETKVLGTGTGTSTGAETRYKFRLDGKAEIPDPASRYQPEGPHGPSQVVEREFDWSDANWKGRPMNQLVIYELHVGTFTPEGTFEAIIGKLDHLVNLGVNAIEIMPIAQFAGSRNWGYDGVGLFAAQNSYADNDTPSPIELKKLINACHALGISVILDVVYNHLGPEGNYLPQLGPYFQSKYKTPWGDALNYDGEGSDEVRRYFLENARQWLEEFHFDGLRLDAVHAILDTSAHPFLENLSQMRDELQTKLGRPLLLIAESEANDSRILRPVEQNGLGLSGQWADDLHHIIHSLLTGEKFAYYQDYGEVAQLEAVYKDGLLFTGQYSDARKRVHGRSFDGIERGRLVVCSQNHDQIGNRMKGERLITLTDARRAKLAAACVFITQNLPLMFMGEEFASRDPFLYFIDHKDPELVAAVRKGRKEEFAGFKWHEDPPDPASPETFEKSKLSWNRLETEREAQEFTAYYKRLIEISKWIRREHILEEGNVSTRLLAEGRVIEVNGHNNGKSLQAFFSFSEKPEQVHIDWSRPKLEIILNSAEDEVSPLQKNSTEMSAKISVGSSAESFVEIQPYSAFVLGTELN